MLSLWHLGRDSILAKSVLSSLKRDALSCSCVATRRLRTALLLPPFACGATHVFSRVFRVCALLPLVARLPLSSLHASQHPNALLLPQTLHVGLYMPVLCQTLHVGLHMLVYFQTPHVGLYMPVLCQTLHVGLHMLVYFQTPHVGLCMPVQYQTIYLGLFMSQVRSVSFC